jgi:predicted homoserine dehydrogenase-like protein
LRFPACSRDGLAQLPERLSWSATVEVTASDDVRCAVFVVFAAADETARRSLVEYGVQTDPQGRWAALYRPNHLVGLELAVSVLRAGLRGEPTGTPTTVCSEGVAVAKRDLRAGDLLDGEGEHTVYVYGARASLERSHAEGLLPTGLSGGVVLKATGRRRRSDRARPCRTARRRAPPPPPPRDARERGLGLRPTRLREG